MNQLGATLAVDGDFGSKTETTVKIGSQIGWVSGKYSEIITA